MELLAFISPAALTNPRVLKFILSVKGVLREDTTSKEVKVNLARH